MMRAASYTRTGSAADVLTIGLHPVPVAEAGEVLVRIAASGINPADVKRRAGWNGARMAHELVIPHSDGAGTIEAVGAGVDPSRIGQRVWLWNAQGGYGTAGRAHGTAAEFIALPQAQALPLSDALSFAEGACLGVPAQTAWLAVMGDGSVTGQTVLVQGAAGAVGSMAVQIALAGGAAVVATVSNGEGAALVQSLAAVQTISRTREDVVARVHILTMGLGVDRIIEVDLAANMAADAEMLAPHGVIASYSCSSNPAPILPYYDFANLGATIRFVQGFILPPTLRPQAEAAIADLTARGALRPLIGATFPLEDIALAHARIESRAPGQTVLTLTPAGDRP